MVDDLRTIFGTAKCQNPGDRIYAVLGFLREKGRELVVKPDYALSVRGIF